MTDGSSYHRRGAQADPRPTEAPFVAYILHACVSSGKPESAVEPSIGSTQRGLFTGACSHLVYIQIYRLGNEAFPVLFPFSLEELSYSTRSCLR